MYLHTFLLAAVTRCQVLSSNKRRAHGVRGETKKNTETRMFYIG